MSDKPSIDYVATKSALDAKITICGDERVHQLQAKLAMMSEALKHANRQSYPFGHLELFDKALTATEQEVSAWRREVEAKAIEGCARLGEANGNTGLLPFELRALAQDRRSEGK